MPRTPLGSRCARSDKANSSKNVVTASIALEYWSRAPVATCRSITAKAAVEAMAIDDAAEREIENKGSAASERTTQILGVATAAEARSRGRQLPEVFPPNSAAVLLLINLDFVYQFLVQVTVSSRSIVALVRYNVDR